MKRIDSANKDSLMSALKSDEGTSSSEDNKEILNGNVCIICCTTQSPLWRNGPGGPFSLCNTCGIRWNVAKTEKSDIPIVETDKQHKPLCLTNAERESGVFVKKNDDGFDEEFYYCKYCDNSWPSTHFRNRQQFGAHCSNCSRKRKVNPIDAENAHKTPVRIKMHKKSKKSHNPQPNVNPRFGSSLAEQIEESNLKLEDVFKPGEIQIIHLDKQNEKSSLEEDVQMLRVKIEEIVKSTRKEYSDLLFNLKKQIQELNVKVDSNIEEFRLSFYRELENQGASVNTELTALKKKN